MNRAVYEHNELGLEKDLVMLVYLAWLLKQFEIKYNKCVREQARECEAWFKYVKYYMFYTCTWVQICLYSLMMYSSLACVQIK